MNEWTNENGLISNSILCDTETQANQQLAFKSPSNELMSVVILISADMYILLAYIKFIKICLGLFLTAQIAYNTLCWYIISVNQSVSKQLYIILETWHKIHSLFLSK